MDSDYTTIDSFKCVPNTFKYNGSKESEVKEGFQSKYTNFNKLQCTLNGVKYTKTNRQIPSFSRTGS